MLLAAWRVVAHVVFEHLAECCVGRNAHGFEAHVFVDELSEFFRADFAKTFESCDFETGLADFLRGLVAFGFVVAVLGHLLVTHAEKRRLQDVQVLLFHEFREELQEERHEQEANVHTIDISIGCDNHFVVTQVLETVFDIERMLQQVEFFVLIDDLLRHAEAVERLTAEAEHRLRLHVTSLGDGAGCGVTFCNENHRFAVERVFHVSEVDLAVAEFAVVQVRLLGTFVGKLLDARDFLAFTFVLRDAVEQSLFGFGILVQVVVELACDVIDDPGAQLCAARRNSRRTELRLCLRFEHRFLDAYGNRSDDAVADVGRIEVLLEVVAGTLDDAFAECLLVRTALRGVLTVHKTVVMLAVLVAVRERAFDVLVLEMDDRIADGVVNVLVQKVQKSVRARIDLAVHDELEAVVQVGVVPDLLFHVRREETVVLENVGIRFKVNFGTVLLVRGTFLVILHKHTTAEFSLLHAAIAEALDHELRGEGVHCLCTHTVQTDRLLESFGIVLAARVDFRYAVDDLAERNATAVVAHAGCMVVDINFNLFARTHHEFVDGVVYNFLDEHVDAVVRAVAIAELADVHAGAEADMFMPFEGLDAVFCIFRSCH